MNTDMLQALVRAAINALAGIAITKGIGDSATWEAIGGGVLALASLAWSYFHQGAIKKAALAECAPAVAPKAKLN